MFLSINNGNKITGNTPETIKHDSPNKEEILRGEIRSYGRDEIKRLGGSNDRQKQDLWNGFRDNNGG